MAYDPKSLVRLAQAAVAAGDMASKHFYATNDAAAVVEAGGYITDKRLRKGDVIEASMARAGTPVTKSYAVTAVNAAGVATLALQTTGAG
jgi:hypothetical protein